MGRAKSSASGQRDRKVQPPRPRNAWILYRSYHSSQVCQGERLSQANISKRISEMWRNETEEVRRHFEQEAEAEKARHQELYPDYRFCPKRKETKKSRKKSKCREVTPSDADDDDDAPPPVPALPPMPYVHHFQQQTQPFFVNGYHHNMVMPQPHVMPYLPEAHHGPGGPSPPMSDAPSPASYQGSASPLPPQSVPSSSSSPSTQPSPTSNSPASFTSSQLPANAMYLPSLPGSHHPSPNPYAAQPLSTHPHQNSTVELSLTSPRLQLRSTENTLTPAVPVWNSYLQSPDSQLSEEVVNLNIAVDQRHSLFELQQGIPPSSPFDSLQGLLSKTDENGVFNLSNIESSQLLTHPQGELEVVLGAQPSTIDYNEDFFTDFVDVDFTELQRQFDSLTEGGPSSSLLGSSSLHEDFQSLFQTPNNPELQAYTSAQQRQPSIFTQDMMDFLNFQAAEDATQDTSPTTSPDPIPTTVSPQQVSLPSPQEAAVMSIFTQMTNTPTVASGTSYVPPPGAIYSSTRRVAASWKPSFAISPSQMDEPVQYWALQAN